MPQTHSKNVGQRAELRVFDSLATLPTPWKFFSTVEWRNLRGDGEVIGEADVVVFHPQYGLVVFEIKAGAVDIQDGAWFYASGLAMKQSPFSQARRNRYALVEKLTQRLGKATVDTLLFTHAAWVPDVIWRGTLPGTDAPSRAFLLDRSALADPETALLRLFREAAPSPQAWSRSQQQVLKEVLAPDCHLLVPLASKVDDAVHALYSATEQQIAVLRMLRSQSRLLVEGGAGSGKTVLACMLAREHAALGKSVLLTCYNRHLAQHLATTLADVSGITVMPFHELARSLALATGQAYVVPTDNEARARFFRDESAELLLSAAETGATNFDSIIVDEAADFAPTWWVALEALGAPNFSWYCLYDRKQSIYQTGENWEPPFAGIPMSLDINLRNTRAIGDFASRLGQCTPPEGYRVEAGDSPIVHSSQDFTEMADQLRQLLRDLIRKEALTPDQIVVLAPYRHTNPQSGWAAGLNEVNVTTEMVNSPVGRLRVGTIQGFKGLEADVVILVGIDAPASKHPEWLYVGASRARVVLHLLAQEKAGLH